jgi:hypothetical protein
MKLQISRLGFYSITDYRWLALVAALLAALLALSGQISRGDESEGSGIGGTGRTQVPGSESGLGGTGFRPYLGSSTHRANSPAQPELVLWEDATLTPIAALVEHNTAANIPAPEIPIPRIVELISPTEVTTNSTAISIVEQIQHDLDRDVVLLQQAAEYRAEELEGYVDSPFLPSPEQQLASAAQSGNPNTGSGTGGEDAARTDTGSTDAGTTDADRIDTESELSWSSLAAMLGQTNSGSQVSAAGDVRREQTATEPEIETDRIHRPERIARPSLPPVQRVRPLQRPGLLPPRIRPLPL